MTTIYNLLPLMYNFHFSSIKLSIIFEERERENFAGTSVQQTLIENFLKKKNITEKKTRMYIYTHTYIYTFTLLHIRATFFYFNTLPFLSISND